MIDLLLSAKHGREGALAPLSLWRSVWSTVLEFNTLTRFSDAIQLRVTDLSFPSQPAPHLSVSFAKSKNDQYSEGSQRLVASLPNEPKYCPVRLTKLYLSRLGRGYLGYLIPRVRADRLTGLQRPEPDQALSYTTFLEDFHKLLHSLGYDGSKFGTHSGK